MRRTQLLIKNKERVANHNKKVMEVYGTRANSQGNAKLIQLEQKVSAAEERRLALLQKNLDRVATHNKKVMEQRQKGDSPEKKHSLL